MRLDGRIEISLIAYQTRAAEIYVGHRIDLDLGTHRDLGDADEIDAAPVLSRLRWDSRTPRAARMAASVLRTLVR